MLDPQAAQAYHDEIAELRAEIDDADRCADVERAATARVELDQLVEHLTGATGLAGKPRSFGHDAERARVAVHKAIKRALTMIGDVDLELGREIRDRVMTGARCVFMAHPG